MHLRRDSALETGLGSPLVLFWIWIYPPWNGGQVSQHILRVTRIKAGCRRKADLRQISICLILTCLIQKNSSDYYQVGEAGSLALWSWCGYSPWVPEFPPPSWLCAHLDLPLNVIVTKVIGSTASLRGQGYLLVIGWYFFQGPKGASLVWMPGSLKCLHC